MSPKIKGTRNADALRRESPGEPDAVRPTNKGRTRPTPRPNFAWLDRAACRNLPTEWWFPEQAGTPTGNHARARAICATCPVQTPCGEFGASQEYGYWGRPSDGVNRRTRSKNRRARENDAPEGTGRPRTRAERATRTGTPIGAHMANTNKQRGTAYETAVVNALVNAGFLYAERRALHGAHDLGDITGIPGIVMELKNHSRIDLAGWVDQANTEGNNAGAFVSIVVHKRRGHPADRSYVTMDFPTLCTLLKEAGYA